MSPAESIEAVRLALLVLEKRAARCITEKQAAALLASLPINVHTEESETSKVAANAPGIDF